MSLDDDIQLALSERGPLSREMTGFRVRPGQLEMARGVAEVLEQGGALVVEAGTGIGKTFAYLVPALLSGRTIMISTATRTLQDQLYKRDIPHLLRALGLPRRVALLKGRSSYLCLDRLTRARQEASGTGTRIEALLWAVTAWSGRTLSGDLAELSELDESSPLIPRISSTRESCTGSACSSYAQCHVNKARREALSADVLVVNHHLFFSDFLVRESGVAELLPSVQGVIFDEAHQLNQIGVQFLGRHLSAGQVAHLAQECRAIGQQQARGLQDWDGLSTSVERAVSAWQGITGNSGAGLRLSWSGRAPDSLDAQQWHSAMQGLHAGLSRLESSLLTVHESGPELARLYVRSTDLLRLLEAFLGPRDDDSVRWLETGDSVRLVECPLDIAGSLRQGLSAQGPLIAHGRSLVFTSASLGTDPALSSFTQSCGLTRPRVLKIPSPFDYPSQAVLYVPRKLPEPSDPEHSVAVARLVANIARSVQGRTLVLTTSLRALSRIAEALQSSCASPSLEILVQGQESKRSLIERFRLGSQGEGLPCVLVASASFWEGLDLPGDVLKVVVIDKLPFPSPTEPLVQARAQRMKVLGRNVFRDYFLPQAALALKQGAGRLIRTETDRGLLVICDRRMLERSYGQYLLAALPPMRRIDDDQALQETLDWLTRPSTTDPSGI